MGEKYLLSIDGGGIRGVIPICALIGLEATTNKLTRDIFSFVAGTSAGAIITGGVAAGIPAETILESYCKLARTIFRRNLFTLPRRIIRGSMYSTRELHNAIAHQLGQNSDWKLNNCPVDVLISAKRLSDGHPWYFVRDKQANSRRTGRLSLADCITGSAAAPTFFEPWPIEEHPRPSHPVGTVVDGGVGVTGNPVYQACVEALYYTGEYPPTEMTAISLGTGRLPAKARPRWLWPWLQWVLSELLQSPAEQQTELVHRHFPDVKLYRLDVDLRAIDPTLNRDVQLDDIERIDQLVACGRRFAASIDWKGILAGTDSRFRIRPDNTQWKQYAQKPDLLAKL